MKKLIGRLSCNFQGVLDWSEPQSSHLIGCVVMTLTEVNVKYQKVNIC